MTLTKPKRVLIIRTGGLGDFILSLPVLAALGAVWPDAELEILGRPSIAALARPCVTRITSIDDRRFARLFTDTPFDAADPAAAYLSSFDLVVSFLGVPESNFGKKLRSLVPRTVFVSAPPSGAKHAAVHFLNCIVAGPSRVRLPGSGKRGQDKSVPGNAIPRLYVSTEDRQEGERLLTRLLGPAATKPIIVVHPGSGSRHKNWPAELFAQTVRLFRRSGFAVILLQGEADVKAVGEVLAHLEGSEAPVLSDASLIQVAGVIACSRLVVGNDSGISHLAAAIGTPLVCLFGPTNPTVWRPQGAAVQVLTFEEARPERVYSEGMKLLL